MQIDTHIEKMRLDGKNWGNMSSYLKEAAKGQSNFWKKKEENALIHAFICIHSWKIYKKHMSFIEY